MFIPKIHRHMGRFMVLPRDHVNAFIVELEKSIVVVDSTLATSDSLELRRKAESLGKPIEAVLVTHGHPDHYGGLVSFKDLPRFGSQGCLEFAHREDIKKSPTASHYLGDDWPTERYFPNEIIPDGFNITFGGVKFTFKDLGPAESDSDGMWIFESDGITNVFIGDTVALRCHCFFRDGHYFQWLDVLNRLEKEFDLDKTRFWFGHGEVPSSKEVLEWQKGYHQAFLEAVRKIEDRTIPVPRSIQEQVIADMQKFLPTETTLFLLDYEMDITLADMYKKVTV